MRFRLEATKKSQLFSIGALALLVAQIFSGSNKPILLAIFLLIAAIAECDFVEIVESPKPSEEQ